LLLEPIFKKALLVKSPFEIKYSSLLNTTDVQEHPSFGSHFLEESSPDQAKLLHTDTRCTKNGSRNKSLLVQRKDWSEAAGGRISRMGDFYDRSKNSQRLSTDENGLEISVLMYTTVPRDETSGAGCFGNSINLCDVGGSLPIFMPFARNSAFTKPISVNPEA
jgi:hypothetical protein